VRNEPRAVYHDGVRSTPTGTRTPVPWLRTKYPGPLDDGGVINKFIIFPSRSVKRLARRRRFAGHAGIFAALAVDSVSLIFSSKRQRTNTPPSIAASRAASA